MSQSFRFIPELGLEDVFKFKLHGLAQLERVETFAQLSDKNVSDGA